jgi:hypothetical protein
MLCLGVVFWQDDVAARVGFQKAEGFKCYAVIPFAAQVIASFGASFILGGQGCFDKDAPLPEDDILTEDPLQVRGKALTRQEILEAVCSFGERRVSDWYQVLHVFIKQEANAGDNRRVRIFIDERPAGCESGSSPCYAAWHCKVATHGHALQVRQEIGNEDSYGTDAYGIHELDD